jgi:hypothetical protein
MSSKATGLPGFNADAVFDRTNDRYRLESTEANTPSGLVVPQLPKWFRCIAAVAGAAATCQLTAAAGPAGWTACAAATVAATAICD